MASEGKYIDARDCDCIESIAARSGLFWETVWDHPKNKKLRDARLDPNILMEGDQVFVPEKREGLASCGTEQRHRFQRKGTPSKIRIFLKRGGRPRANERYIVKIDGTLTEGITDSQGLVKIAVPPGTKEGEIVIGDNDFNRRVIPLNLGGMDPIGELRGIQKRLANLGFDCEPSGEFDDQTQGAVAMFQKAYDLEVTGQIDDKTRDKIRMEHGS